MSEDLERIHRCQEKLNKQIYNDAKMPKKNKERRERKRERAIALFE